MVYLGTVGCTGSHKILGIYKSTCNMCLHMGGNFQGCSHAVNCHFKAPPLPPLICPPQVMGPSTCKQTNRGTKRRTPPKYIENTFQAIQLEYFMHSNKQCYKIFISSVILGDLSLFEITRASVLFFQKCQVQFNVLRKRFLFAKKNSVTRVVNYKK